MAFPGIIRGGLYDVFLSDYDAHREAGDGADECWRERAEVGDVAIRALNFTPENVTDWEDVGKALLSVDAAHFAGRFHDRVVEILTSASLLRTRHHRGG